MSYNNKNLDDKFSQYNKIINPNGSGNLILGTEFWQGVINQSANGTIEQICYADNDYSIGLHITLLIKPDSTHTTTLVDTTVAALSAHPNVRLNAALAAGNLVLTGSKGDWALLEFNSVAGSVDYQKYILVDYQNY